MNLPYIQIYVDDSTATMFHETMNAMAFCYDDDNIKARTIAQAIMKTMDDYVSQVSCLPAGAELPVCAYAIRNNELLTSIIAPGSANPFDGFDRMIPAIFEQISGELNSPLFCQELRNDSALLAHFTERFLYGIEYFLTAASDKGLAARRIPAGEAILVYELHGQLISWRVDRIHAAAA